MRITKNTKMKFGFTALIGLLMLLLTIGFAAAAPACSLLTGPNDANEGDTFSLNFVNTYLPPTIVDVTLHLGAQGLSTTDPLTVNGIAFMGSTSWSVTAATSGDKTVTADLLVGGVPLCTVEKNFTVFPDYPDPVLAISISQLDDLVLNQNYNVQVDLTNNGAGDAFNVSGLINVVGATSTPDTFAVNQIAVAGVDTSTYALTPTACGNGNNFVVNVQNYEDQGGELMLPVSDSEDFNVIGSDLHITSFTPASASIPQEGQTTFTLNVDNLGTMTATNAGFRLQRDGNGFATPTIASIAPGASGALNYAFDAAGIAPGVYTISATVAYTEDCASASTKTDSFPLTINAGTCSDNVQNAGETGVDCGGPTCSACSTTPPRTGGGGGNDYDTIGLTLNEETPSAIALIERGDSVRIEFEGKKYYFQFTRIFPEYARIEVRIGGERVENDVKAGETIEYDLNGDGQNDLSIEMLELKNRIAKAQFELLGLEKEKQYVPIRDIHGHDSDQTDQTVDVQQPGDEQDKEEETFVNGIISFVEEFSLRRAATPALGAGIAAVIIVIGLIVYFVWPRKY